MGLNLKMVGLEHNFWIIAYQGFLSILYHFNFWELHFPQCAVWFKLVIDLYYVFNSVFLFSFLGWFLGQSSTGGRFKMEERFKPSIREETKTEIMRSMLGKEALDEKERGTFLLIKMLRILGNCKAWPTSRSRTKGENSDSNKSIRTKFSILCLERKTIENLPWDIRGERNASLLLYSM